MTTYIEIDAAEFAAAYADDGAALKDLLDRTYQGRQVGPVYWRAGVTRESLYWMESLHRLAQAERAEIQFTVAEDLDPAETAFFDDYILYRLAPSRAEKRQRKSAELTVAAREAFDAAVRFRPGKLAPPPIPETAAEAAIIGIYGGDHIGDAAILGGTVLGLHKRFGLTKATVYSSRPEHTRRLVAGLDLPVDLEVDEYRAANVAARLDKAQILVLAGGPLFGSPRILARHLAAAEEARARGLPFLIERVGVIDFKKSVLEKAARRLFEMGSEIVVRSEETARHKVLVGLNPTVAKDPAFDYLKGHAYLSRLPDQDQEQVRDLLAGTQGATLIGLNLRPTEDNWQGLAGPTGALVDPAFLENLVTGLEQFAAQHAKPVTYVVFPMNALQLGMSDLSAAIEFKRAAAGRLDVRYWQADPSLDGVLHLIRKLDAIVAMRFHGTIFALSQKKPTLGIDYFPNPGGKVTQLLTDLRKKADASTVQSFTSDWLVKRLKTKFKTPKPK